MYIIQVTKVLSTGGCRDGFINDGKFDMTSAFVFHSLGEAEHVMDEWIRIAVPGWFKNYIIREVK